jgi:hypothetical protein
MGTRRPCCSPERLARRPATWAPMMKARSSVSSKPMRPTVPPSVAEELAPPTPVLRRPRPRRCRSGSGWPRAPRAIRRSRWTSWCSGRCTPPGRRPHDGVSRASRSLREAHAQPRPVSTHRSHTGRLSCARRRLCPGRIARPPRLLTAFALPCSPSHSSSCYSPLQVKSGEY